MSGYKQGSTCTASHHKVRCTVTFVFEGFSFPKSPNIFFRDRRHHYYDFSVCLCTRFFMSTCSGKWKEKSNRYRKLCLGYLFLLVFGIWHLLQWYSSYHTILHECTSVYQHPILWMTLLERCTFINDNSMLCTPWNERRVKVSGAILRLLLVL